jgi:hypothetical protein
MALPAPQSTFDLPRSLFPSLSAALWQNQTSLGEAENLAPSALRAKKVAENSGRGNPASKPSGIREMSANRLEG